MQCFLCEEKLEREDLVKKITTIHGDYRRVTKTIGWYTQNKCVLLSIQNININLYITNKECVYNRAKLSIENKCQRCLQEIKEYKYKKTYENKDFITIYGKLLKQYNKNPEQCVSIQSSIDGSLDTICVSLYSCSFVDKIISSYLI